MRAGCDFGCPVPPFSKSPKGARRCDCQYGRRASAAADAHSTTHCITEMTTSCASRFVLPTMTDDGACSRARPPSKCRADKRFRYRLPDLLSFALSMELLVLISILLRPAAAASVPFENCLPDSYINYTPLPLQWVPLFVDASFDTSNPRHTLRVTMWGNVSGSFTNVTLPPANSPDWKDPTKLDGKILDEPEPNSPAPKLTTLHSKIDVLTYEPWSLNTNFCNTSLTNASCPLGPVFGTNSSSLTPAVLAGLPSVSMTNDFYSSYAFASFSATFLIIYGDSKGTNIGCVSTTVTPDLGNLAWMLKFLPLIVLLFVGVATVFAGIFSPWGTTDIFHWTSNYGRDADLLRLVTPGFGDCLQYIQFVTLTGGLTLNYPGFYQPIISQGSWSALMFNESFVSKSSGYSSLRDGIYVTDGVYGLQDLAQLVGMGSVEDVWAGMMIWLLAIIGSMFVLVQTGFFVQWVYRFVKKIPEEDLRAKNIPFTLGNVVRIVLHYFLLPIVALSTFQLVVANDSPAYTVALAVLTLILIIGFAGWLLYLIATTKPRAFLFDDLPTVLLYGPLYNTYSDEAAAFALIPVLCTFLRGIAVGAVQPAGVAQLVLLAICEVIQILTLHAFRPFHSPTSMNAYHTLFSALRLVTVLLMVAFVPSLGVTEGPKGWIGYAILLTHAAVLVLGFFLNAIQTIVEVVARMLGAGGDHVRGQSRGGLSKIFGARQLSRRLSRREAGPSRQSQLSSSAMLDAEEASKSGYIMPGGRLRSESAGSMGVLVHHRQRSSSALENLSLDLPVRNFDSGASSFTPTTPGEASMFSFLPSPSSPGQNPGAVGMQAAHPYYRPPRQRRPTMDIASSSGPKTGSGDWSQKRLSQVGGPLGEPAELDGSISRSATPAPYAPAAVLFTPRTDYATREVDFYYGVRGQRLNSDGPSRKLGTGPADPTGPMASAAGWFRNIFGGKTKEKGKGFEVVRSARMPPAMRARGGDFEAETPPEGIPVAMGTLRNGPIESDDEDEGRRMKSVRSAHAKPNEAALLNEDGTPQEEDTDDLEISHVADVPPVLPDIVMGGSIDEDRDPPVPHVPRKSSKRTPDHSRNPSATLSLPSQSRGSRRQTNLAPSTTASSRLPFERTPSQKRLSGSSAGVAEDFSQIDLQDTPSGHDERSTIYGFVHQGSVNRVDRDVDLLGSSAEVVDERR
ncbi:putative flavin carrier protein 3 [Diplogelasinospora grovesii]|uniref:Flavin carrier protein 3 n=1 Tax=Diplogelasinospora grovesii TaxID=303347 RepID=A0AAN6S656_9PEZI|nr:putative flavin carrier protein 3 [Diplogelasinospora grovesii]